MLKKLAKWIDPLANPDTESGLDEVIGTFSLNNAQLYVGCVQTEDGRAHKVLKIRDASYEEGAVVGLYQLSSDDAARFVSFLEEALQGNLPVEYEFPRSETRLLWRDGRAKWKISKFIDEWHHGGGYKGKLGGTGGYVITKRSAERLKECVAEFFSV